MALFNKVLARIGIGAAKVDTKLYKDQLTAGSKIEGVVEVYGGNIEQEIDSIYLQLFTSYVREVDDKKVKQDVMLNNFKITNPFVITPGETKQLPFSFELPKDTPITMGKTRVWVATGLDIKNAVDPQDVDYVNVLPNKMVSAVIPAMEQLGFRLRQVECEEAPRRMRKRLPFVQEFEFVPTRGPYFGKLDEVEVIVQPDGQDQYELLIEVDRRARGLGGFLAEALEMDETLVKTTVHERDTAHVKSILDQLISKYS
ncbi:sporulation protein [Metabacillus iocasae]|uniref:Sporulation-control protein n=1 Tax=Priestia iocasae TaxID=2291674 RepID=A0ABS2QUK9_9BACI|nr:sporulation protein [Metabacillus iocasae]MBM7703170.1 sporulation-control protein [Metabacillus iocasae]